jgi:predicted small secreted protein
VRRVVRLLAAIALLVLGAALLTACGFGDTGQPTDVTDVGAKVTGTVHNTTVEPTDYWFEFGTSTSYDRATPHQTVNVTSTSSGYAVSSMLGGLDEHTTYHYRLCTRGASGFGVCGGDATFTTTTGRDSVSGTGVVFSIPDIGYTIGASVFATSGPDGASPVRGTASTSPSFVYFKVSDSGAVTCLRVGGNRAAIGFVANTDIGQANPEPIPIMLFVEDNGLSGDRIGFGRLTNPATTCPTPTDADFVPFIVGDTSVPPVVTSGDFTVHDHTG